MAAKITSLFLTILMLCAVVPLSYFTAEASGTLSGFGIIGTTLDDPSSYIGETRTDVVNWRLNQLSYYLMLPNHLDLSSLTPVFTVSPINSELWVLPQGSSGTGTRIYNNQPTNVFQNSFSGNTSEARYTLRCGTTSSFNTYTLVIRRQGNVGSVFISLQENLNYIHANKDNRSPGHIIVMDSEGRIDYNGYMDHLKGRGNATWGGAKKPYNVRLQDRASLLGYGESRKWNLIANHFDRSMMNNIIASEIARGMGVPFVHGHSPVDLYIDNEYLGLYTLAEKVEIEDYRVDIQDLESATELANDVSDLSVFSRGGTTGNFSRGSRNQYGVHYKYRNIPNNPEDITGGYLLEFDLDDRYNNEASGFVTSRGASVVIKYPEFASQAQVEYIRGFFQDAENAIYSSSGINNKLKHYNEYIDLESFARMYVFQEYAKNLDVGITSSFLYKDSDLTSDGKIYGAVPWDFDHAFGDADSNRDGFDLRDPRTYWASEGRIHNHPDWTKHMIAEITKFPQFKQQAQYEYYTKLKPYLDKNLPGLINTLHDDMLDSAVRNYIRWDGNVNDRFSEAVYGTGTQLSNMGLLNYLIRRNNFFSEDWSMPSSYPYPYPYVNSNPKESVVINQLYGGGEKGDTKISHNFIELYNPTNQPVKMEGWTLEYINNASGGDVNDGADGMITLNVTLPAKGKYFIKGAEEQQSDSAFPVIKFTNDNSDCDRYVPHFVLGNKDCRITLYDENRNVIDGFGRGELSSVPEEGKFAMPAGNKHTIFARTNGEDTNKRTDFFAYNFNSWANPETYGRAMAVPEKTYNGPDHGEPVTVKDSVVINQVFGGGGKHDSRVSHNFVELYNPTDYTVDMTGWKLKYFNNGDGADGELVLDITLMAGDKYFIKGYEEQQAVSGFPIIQFEEDDRDCDRLAQGFVLGNKDCRITLYDAQDNVIDGFGRGALPSVVSEGEFAVRSGNKHTIYVRDGGDTNKASDFKAYIFNSDDPESVLEQYMDAGLKPGKTFDNQPSIPKGSIVINQVFGGGSQSDSSVSHNFIELYNPTNQAINMEGWTVEYFNNGNGADGTVELNVTLPPKMKYFIKGAKEDQTNPNFPIIKYTDNDSDCDKFVPDMTLGNNDCRITLLDAENNVIDGFGRRFLPSVQSEGEFAVPEGNKHTIYARTNGIDRNREVDFTAYIFNAADPNQVLQEYKDAGLETSRISSGYDPGTPGTPKGSVVINQIFGAGGRGDTRISHNFIELYNPTDQAVDMTDWKLSYNNNGRGEDGVITLNAILPPDTKYFIKGFKETQVNSGFPIVRFTDDDSDCDRLAPGLILSSDDNRITLFDADDNVIDGFGRRLLMSVPGEGSFSVNPGNKNTIYARVNGIDTNRASDFRTFNFGVSTPYSVLTNYTSEGLLPDKNIEDAPGDPKGSIVINQVYGGGTQGDTGVSHNFIELYNPTDKDVDMTGWRIVYSNDNDTGGFVVLDSVLEAGAKYFIKGSEETQTGSDFPILKFETNSADTASEDCHMFVPEFVLGHANCNITLYDDQDNVIDGFGRGEFSSLLSEGRFAVNTGNKHTVYVRTGDVDTNTAADFTAYDFSGGGSVLEAYETAGYIPALPIETDYPEIIAHGYPYNFSPALKNYNDRIDDPYVINTNTTAQNYWRRMERRINEDGDGFIDFRIPIYKEAENAYISLFVHSDTEAFLSDNNGRAWRRDPVATTGAGDQRTTNILTVDVSEYIDDGYAFIRLQSIDNAPLYFISGKVFYDHSDYDVDIFLEDTNVVQGLDNEWLGYMYGARGSSNLPSIASEPQNVRIFCDTDEMMLFEVPLNPYALENNQILTLYLHGENLGLFVAGDINFTNPSLYTYSDVSDYDPNFKVLQIDLSEFIAEGKTTVFFALCNITYWNEDMTRQFLNTRPVNGGALWGFSTQTRGPEFEMEGSVLVKYNGNRRDVVIPGTVTEIAEFAFGENSRITSVTIPESVMTIGNMAFVGCNNLNEVYFEGSFPDSFGNADENVFLYCSSLLIVYYPENDPSWKNFAENGYKGVLQAIAYTPGNPPEPIPIYTVNVESSSGGKISGGGRFRQGMAAIITAEAYAGYNFEGWYDGNTKLEDAESDYSFAVMSDVSLEARFSLILYTVSVSAGPPEGGTVAGGNSYVHNASVILNAAARTGYTFDGWYENGNKISASNMLSFNADRNRTLQARFVKTPDGGDDKKTTERFTIRATAGSGGRVTGGGTFDKDKTVTLNAVSNKGFSFDGWYENNRKISGARAAYSFKAAKNRTLQARFKVIKVKSVKLNKKTLRLGLQKNRRFQLRATITPTGARNKKVTWKSSKPRVVSVSKTGRLTARKKGTANITVTTRDGKKRRVCRVRVN